MGNSKIPEANTTFYGVSQLETTSTRAEGNNHSSSDLYHNQRFSVQTQEQLRDSVLAKVELCLTAENILKDVKDELEEAKKIKSEINEFNKSISDTISEYKTKIDRNMELLEEVKKLIEKESKLCVAIDDIRWWMVKIGVFSFFCIPVIAFIILLCIDKNIVVSKFNVFFGTWFAYLCAICGILAVTGLANLYRITSAHKKEIDKLKEENKQRN